MKKSSYKPFPLFRELNFTQAGAVQNTWYMALSGNNIELIALAVGVTVANETLGIRITIDGEVFNGSVAVNLGEYSACGALRIDNIPDPTITMGATGATAELTSTGFGTSKLKGRIVTVEVRKTTAAGASAVLCKGYYRQS